MALPSSIIKSCFVSHSQYPKTPKPHGMIYVVTAGLSDINGAEKRALLNLKIYMSIKNYISTIALVQYASALALSERMENGFAQIGSRVLSDAELVNSIVANMAEDGVIRIPI